MKYLYLYRTRILGALAILVTCSGCMFALVGKGHADVPENSAVTLQASAKANESAIFYRIDGSSYSLAPSTDTWEVEQQWNLIRYDDALKLRDSFAFSARYMEKPVSFFRCGERLLLLSEYSEDDSLKLTARWFDMSAKPVSDAAVLVSCILEGDNEREEKSPYGILPSPDSSHFLVRNRAYPEDGSFTTGLWVFNSRLEQVQKKNVNVSGWSDLKTAQVDNAGALYTVQTGEKGSMRVQRFAAGGSSDITIPVVVKDVPDASVGSALLLPDGESGYLFSIVEASERNAEEDDDDESEGDPVKMKKLLIHTCNWSAGKAEVLAEHITDERVARKIADDVAMGHFHLQKVFPTQQGFVVWAELMADTVMTIYTGRSTNRTAIKQSMFYGGTTGLFAFDKKGSLLWQKGLVQKTLVGRKLNRDGSAYVPASYVSAVSDTLCVLKWQTDEAYNANHTFSPRSYFMLNRVSVTSGETGVPMPVLQITGWVKIPNDEMWYIDRRNMLIPCYEGDHKATRLMHLRF